MCPTTAKRAMENYFSPGNLTALRELALRRTAQRVDEQLLSHMQAHAIPGPGRPATGFWSASTSSRAAPRLSAMRSRQADRLRAPWTALHVETSALGRSVGGRQGPAGGDAAPRRAAGRRGRHDSRARMSREDIVRHADDPQLHPYRRRQAAQAALARMFRGLGHRTI